MKIELIQDHAVQETEITIRCPELTDDILRIMTMLRIEEHRLIGESDGEIRAQYCSRLTGNIKALCGFTN